MRKAIAILLVVLFLVTTTVTAVSASNIPMGPIGGGHYIEGGEPLLHQMIVNNEMMQGHTAEPS